MFWFHVEHLSIPEYQLELACPATINSIERPLELVSQRLNLAAMAILPISGKPQFLKEVRDRVLLLVNLPRRKGQSPLRLRNAQRDRQSRLLISSASRTSTITVSPLMNLPLRSLPSISLPIMISLKIVSANLFFNFQTGINQCDCLNSSNHWRPSSRRRILAPCYEVMILLIIR